MRFLLDQSTDARLGEYLRIQRHDVTRVGRDYPGGLADDAVLSLAYHEHRVLITDDRDFGELVFRYGSPHAGVIFLRLGDYASLSLKIARLHHVLSEFTEQLDQFIVVESRRVRVRRASSPQTDER